MKKIVSIILNVCLLLLIVSCEKPLDEEKIPINRFDFSCKINDKLITLHSPLQATGEKRFLQRIYKTENNSKDSTFLAYEHSFLNDSIKLTIGFSKIVLADTTYQFWDTRGESFKNQIYSTGSHIYQFEDPEWGHLQPTAQFVGFYIKIRKINEGIEYTSYLNQITDLSVSKYNEFKANNSCQISTSVSLGSETNSVYLNDWYIESTFECKLYENGIETNKTIILSKGSYKCDL